MELPPLFGDFSSKLEEYLCSPEKLPIHQNRGPNRLIPREPDISSLFYIDATPLQTTIKVTRDRSTGELLGYKEDVLDSAGQTAKNSTSMQRAPGASEEALRGSSTNYPFWPGGLEEPDIPQLNDNLLGDVDFENDLLTVPPGFTHGMEFPKDKSPAPTHLSSQAKHTKTAKMLDLSSLLSTGDFEDEWWSDLDEWKLAENKKRKEEQHKNINEKLEAVSDSATRSLEDLTQVDAPSFLQKSQKQESDMKWAFWVDITTPVDNFNKQVKDPAYKWPFELDTFQKQAILHLENHESVFVAAHTSAGKTVVAEYAIALSARHMTRTIYTSPIKALSNQKFRDFKQTFKDVGLLTGDVQISSEAQCLIMTTEILRSMLYNGADTIRDLEWVIFDEVHYINDSERGVVWEEVLIMLPDHVNIILLSATVPNSLEFADWVGKTKKKKIYVISTLKRPVPLEHFIYTGNSTKTSNECFLIVGPEGTFLSKGYNDAVAAKKARVTKSSAQFGPKGTRSGDPRQDKGVWLSVIDRLKKNNLLPVVAFTFSKRKCDENAVALSSVDLTTQAEKSEIHIFFHKCISRLKGSDRQLPQVLHMQEILKRGVGVHHSGILPILKEVIEMLFQRGLVKLLFATETFAMGVNMPARTVVFDSLRKHDGTNYRALQPGEYIQMAGRAGRRGLDSTGTVMILCKGDVPETSELHNIILGKPTKLESQFRLTYGMMLNLLRVEKLRVEDMMKRSFSEFHTQKNVNEYKAELEQLNVKLANLKVIECSYCGDIETFYSQHKEYVELDAKVQDVVMSHPQIGKVLSPGRIVIVRHKSSQKQAGVILKSSSSNKGRKFSVLLLCDREEEENECGDSSAVVNNSAESHISEFVNMRDLYLPEGRSSHKVVEILSDQVTEITTKVLKIACDKVLDDYNKRQIPRFRHDPVGQSASKATQELLHLVESNVHGLPVLDPVKDLGISDIDTVEEFMDLTKKRDVLGNHGCLKCPQFDAHFKLVKSNMRIKEEVARINWLLSDKSLQLLPEYIQRLEVLEALKYIDDTNTVKLKGRVACEISNNELIITELIFDGVFSDLHPQEIAALLSCMVFEEKRCAEPKLVSSLEKGVNQIKKIAERIGQEQEKQGMLELVDSFVSRFKFGLVEVVYEWARGMPFNQIATLTDVTEGIIVRTIQRLDETLRDVRNAARLVGDPALCQKMEESSTLIKRDIVFAASLYTV